VKFLRRTAIIFVAFVLFVLVVFIAGFLFKAQTASGSTFDRLTALSNIYAWALAAVSTAVTMVAVAIREEHPHAAARQLVSETNLDQAVRDLADVARVRWADEAVIRGLLQPQPMHVRWSATGRPVAAHPADVLGEESLRGWSARLRFVVRRSVVRTGRAGGTIRGRFRPGFLLSCASGGLR